MVKKLLKFFAYTFFFVVALMVFVPKTSIYYLLEKNLKKFDVVISDEQLKESLLSLNITNAHISTKGIDSAIISKSDITLLLFYNKLSFRDIKLSSIVETYLPSKIASLEIDYSLLHPLTLEINAEGDFGEARGSLHLLDRDVSLILKPSKKMFTSYKKSLRFFKKDKDGEYTYAKSL